MSSKALRKIISCQRRILWGSEELNVWSNLKEGNFKGEIIHWKQFHRGQSSRENLPLTKKRTSEKFKCEFDFAFEMFQIFSLFIYL